MSEKYTKKVPEKTPVLDPGVRYENARRRSEAIAFNSLPYEERKSKIWGERRKTARDVLIPVAALGALSVTGHEITGAPWHVKDQTPATKHGDHHNLTPVTSPGNGIIHTEKGQFQVGSIGTAVAAEKQGDKFVEVDPITLAEKK